jgi:hypothetical protein
MRLRKGVLLKLLAFPVFHFEGLNTLASLHYEHELSLTVHRTELI